MIALSNLEAVNAWPTPTIIYDVRDFMASAYFCRKFIKSFTPIARLITHLKSENFALKWAEECQLAFNQLNVAFNFAPYLLLHDTVKQFLLKTEGPDYAFGAFLL